MLPRELAIVLRARVTWLIAALAARPLAVEKESCPGGSSASVGSFG